MKRLSVVGGMGLISMALATTALAQAAFTVVPTWEGITACSGRPVNSPSPKFVVSNVPAGTVEFELKMVDLDAPTFSHGGGKVAYSGKAELSSGAFKFVGPCPPATHRYEWTIVARDSAGKRLGTASATIRYP